GLSRRWPRSVQVTPYSFSMPNMRRSITSHGTVQGMQGVRMVRLATVTSTFHARVIAARVGAEGMVTELRGNLAGPYPTMGEVHVYIAEDDLPSAQELLMADEVESAFDNDDGPERPGASPALWVVVAAFIALTAVLLIRF